MMMTTWVLRSMSQFKDLRMTSASLRSLELFV